MIVIDVSVDANGILKHIKTDGHSGYGKNGADIVCAGVSCLVQTGYILLKQMLRQCVKLVSDVNTKTENVLEYEVLEYPQQLQGQLIGITSFILTGLTTLQKQYTENIKININLR